MRKKYISYEYILLYLQIVVITFFVLLLSAFYMKIEGSNFLDNGLYSKNVVGFEIADEKEVLEQLLTDMEKDMVLFKDISGDNHYRRGFYGIEPEELFSFSSYVEEGRFLEKDDYDKKAAVVVIGSDVLKDTFMENGKRYYGYNGKEYEVIGVFRQTKTDLDKVVYLNLTSIMETEAADGIYYIDSSDNEKNHKLREQIFASGANVREVNYENVQSDMNSSHKIKFILAVVAAFCNISMIAIYFIKKQNYKIAIYKLCGLSDWEIARGYLARLVITVTLAYVTGCVILTLLKDSFLVSYEQIHLKNYILTFLITVFAIGIVTFNLIKSLRKTDIGSSLKGV